MLARFTMTCLKKRYRPDTPPPTSGPRPPAAPADEKPDDLILLDHLAGLIRTATTNHPLAKSYGIGGSALEIEIIL